jgi:hypothetical protein
VSDGVNNLIVKDLLASGLTVEDVSARRLENPERAVTQTPPSVEGYALPYWTIDGKPTGFYRVRLFEHDPKYRQPKDTPNHVYFPRGLQSALFNKDYILVTEGEKKAALAVKHGIPCIAFGGVDSWRNRIILLPAESAFTQHGKNQLQAKVPQGGQSSEDYDAPVALGFPEFIALCIARKLNVVICYDTDNETGVKYEVQRAAATLAYELRFRGVAFQRIRQLVLPAISAPDYGSTKVSLDDYIQHQGADAFRSILVACLARRSAFPVHPNTRDYVNKRLQKSKMSRREIQQVSLAILSDLDSHGIRLRSPTDTTYYFDFGTKQLLKSSFAIAQKDAQFDAPFTQYLYQRYGISGADNRLLIWLGTQFTSEEPIDEVSPHRVVARLNNADDSVIYQLSDSQYAKVDATGLTIRNNGEDGVLFEADQVEPLDVDRLKGLFVQMNAQELKPWWADVLGSVRLKEKERLRIATGLLYYISPWLHRWRGMQLPVELIIGESGSGKSTLCELRLTIQTGRPHLRNAPQDLKDWHASVTSTGGLHVTDNVQLVDKSLRQRLSDEICRIVTEPDPSIEQRKYYTNADLIRLPVRAVFAITAIQQPFQNADILQRSMFLELDKSLDSLTYDSEWKSQQLKRFGGREAWIAHHLVALHRFFIAVKKDWNPRYMAKSRLINFEQSMLTMAKLFKLPGDWIPDYLVGSTDRAISENDWTLEGIQQFTLQMNGHITEFGVSEISAFAASEDDFKACEMLINPRRLARYIKSHKGLIGQLAGIHESGTKNNRQMYKIVRPSNKSGSPIK